MKEEHMDLKKNDQFTGVCVDYTIEGLGIVKQDRFCFFVKDLLIGEQAKILVTAIKKNVGYGKVIERLTTSCDRVVPTCPQASLCGGCQLQHMSAKHQANWKWQHVVDCFKRIGKMDIDAKPIISMEDPWKYRNKVQVPVGIDEAGQVVTGFYRNHSHDIINYDCCALQSDLENEIVQVIKQLIMKIGNPTDYRHILVKHGFLSQQVMIVFIARKRKLSGQEILIERLIAMFPQIRSIVLNLNQRTDNVILGDEEILLWGSRVIEEQLGDFTFQISAKSFYQVNPIQTKKLYETAIEFAQCTGKEKVLDLYCGTGTIGLFASKKAKQVIGVEVVPQAIEDAKENAKLNHIDNIEFFCGDAGEYTQKLVEQKVHLDVVLIDPPRKGLNQATLEALAQIQADRIVYVSCNPSTLARDCKVLVEDGYLVEKVQPLDMFPNTVHVETVALLTRKA